MSRIVILLCSLMLACGAAQAQQSNNNSTSGFNLPIPNIPGKSITALVVNYPPGGGTPPWFNPIQHKQTRGISWTADK